MDIKKCFKCNKEKPLFDFYKHKKMGDGFLNKCKECTKKEAKKRHYEKYKDPIFIESERKRARERYKRLNYKDKQKVWDEKRPWSSLSIYKNLNRDFKIKKGFEFHHWNYNLDYVKDGFILERSDHKKLHTKLNFINEKRIFETKDGCILNTKEKHRKFISSIGICFEEIK